MCCRNFPWRRSLTYSVPDMLAHTWNSRSLCGTRADTDIWSHKHGRDGRFLCTYTHAISQIKELLWHIWGKIIKKNEDWISFTHILNTHAHTLSHRLKQPHSFMGGDGEHKITCSKQNIVSEGELLWTQIWIMVSHTNTHIYIHTEWMANSPKCTTAEIFVTICLK